MTTKDRSLTTFGRYGASPFRSESSASENANDVNAAAPKGRFTGISAMPQREEPPKECRHDCTKGQQVYDNQPQSPPTRARKDTVLYCAVPVLMCSVRSK